MAFQGFRSFLFPKKYDLKGSIAALVEEFQQIRELESLEKHPAWQAVRGLLTVQIREIEERLFELCARPVENEKEIQGLIALRLASMFFLGIPDLCKGDEKQIFESLEKRLQILKATTENQAVPLGSTA